ncbi:glucosamine-6-phosphate deaminase [Liquorilactobacillus sucicola DSM 21376 = JCM 15457]|uniref:Glucosamine-6-phosphate deaminase n=1 Tax=Liquorilactobacillus sucicola DSM 21376 = JCM 15457 TaxID=1423806 RepID=A0A023CZK4_9LACO|nr:glucosamine-6-phosphate deaminase [Liquorilactobacillus sucicola]KRN07217.1 glucosamine-6-phosphate isomerase [Liquorilactobacillus sucicola DSM 21376 = JCM 15457]GAJ27348.1 glucosamine-6-phosphate deaminase [Liquorilactobacillus sucicola DSM 21376 = JCM 15457]
MKISIVKDKNQGGQLAYNFFKEELDRNSQAVFGLATGSTPLTTYEVLVRSDLDFSNSISINLDEYVGLAADHPQSYKHYMWKNLFQYKPFQHSYLPDGEAADEKSEISRYDSILEKNPIDLQLLGIGRNGHIGFNEPGTSFNLKTHKVELTESTIAANARFFDEVRDVPRYAYSMGIGSILKSKRIILEAFGASKAQAVKDMIEGPVSQQCPASALQTHSDVTVILDEAAAQKLNK